MYSIGAWNVRGLNRSPKQKEVRQVIKENDLHVCAILESHVDIGRLEKVCERVCSNWEWVSNGRFCKKGTRIILGWNSALVDLMVLSYTNQTIHTQVILKDDRKALYCTFVYAENDYQDRRQLWHNLCLHKNFVCDQPWVLLGDFNAALYLDDSVVGASSVSIAMREFRDCVNAIEVDDVNSTGLRFTWNQKPKTNDGLLKKIDSVMSNIGFLNEYPGSYVIFQPYRISDHAPSVLKIQKVTKANPKPFKFFNFIASKSDFKKVVEREWAKEVPGHNMFRLAKRLKLLKKPMRKLLFSQGNVHEKVTRLRVELDQVQRDLDKNPNSMVLREEEALYLAAYTHATLDEERFFKQKSKIDWLKEGDSNSAFFHKSVKARMSRSRVNCVQDDNGTIHEGQEVPKVFIRHFENFLGVADETRYFEKTNLFVKKLEEDRAFGMIREVTHEEIKEAIFSIGNDKAPGPDGYTSLFFKKTCDVVGFDVCMAISDFFVNGRILKEINHTLLALLPKVQTPTKVNDYRPISCCNIIYKCISKIISNRIKEGLDYLVSDISDNILLTQEVMHNYHLNRGPPRCAFKVDIQKAYNTLNWDFLEQVLSGFGFHKTFIQWIMVCVSITSFSISINGEIHGYFKGRRGLRQGVL